MRFAAPTQHLWLRRRSVVDEAYPGDIVVIPDTGNFEIGDTGDLKARIALPPAVAEFFSRNVRKYIENTDPMKAKQLEKGIQQLMDEGVAQSYLLSTSSTAEESLVQSVSF